MNSMVDLFAAARQQKLWFHGVYQDLWFSPDELDAEQAAGRFRWGAVNWSLRDPKEHLANLEERAKDAQDAVERFKHCLAKELQK